MFQFLIAIFHSSKHLFRLFEPELIHISFLLFIGENALRNIRIINIVSFSPILSK